MNIRGATARLLRSAGRTALSYPRFVLACLLMWIASGALRMARKLTPARS
jgi:hypothetical protein